MPNTCYESVLGTQACCWPWPLGSCFHAREQWSGFCPLVLLSMDVWLLIDCAHCSASTSFMFILSPSFSLCLPPFLPDPPPPPLFLSLFAPLFVAPHGLLLKAAKLCFHLLRIQLGFVGPCWASSPWYLWGQGCLHSCQAPIVCVCFIPALVIWESWLYPRKFNSDKCL